MRYVIFGFDFLGSLFCMRVRYMVMVRSIVVLNFICFLYFGGIKNVINCRNDRKVIGNKRLDI